MALTYSWELTSAPGASARTSADIASTTSANPVFTPDVGGDYIFTLTVNDGGADSAPASVTAVAATALALAGGDPTVTAGESLLVPAR